MRSRKRCAEPILEGRAVSRPNKQKLLEVAYALCPMLNNYLLPLSLLAVEQHGVARAWHAVMQNRSQPKRLCHTAVVPLYT
jgi:hypothetical protein